MLYLPKLISACGNLQASGKKNDDEEAQFRYFIELVDESIYMERYLMIKKLQNGEDTDKLIELSPEIKELLQGRDNLPEVIAKLKKAYEESKITEEAEKAEALKKEESGKSPVREENISSSPRSSREESKSNQARLVELEESKTQAKDNKLSNNTMHEISTKTRLETVPEETEKEESKNYENSEELRGSKEPVVANYLAPPNMVVPEAQNKQVIDIISPRGQEELKMEDSDPQSNRFSRSRSLIQHDLEETKENREESVDSPAGLLRNSSQRKRTEIRSEVERSLESKNEGSVNVGNGGVKIIVSSKKRKAKEEQVYDDDYPFDSGLKCNIF